MSRKYDGERGGQCIRHERGNQPPIEINLELWEFVNCQGHQISASHRAVKPVQEIEMKIASQLCKVHVTGPNSPERTSFRSTPYLLSLLNLVANDRNVPDSLLAHARSLEWLNLPSWKLSKLRQTLSHSRSRQFTIFERTGLVCANDTLPLWPWHLLHTNFVK